jgi:transposase
MNLTEEQWLIVEPLIPDESQNEHGGRPRARSRDVLEGTLWIIRTGMPWRALPPEYPSRHVCARCYHRWRRRGVLASVLLQLAEDLEFRVGIRFSDAALVAPDTARGRSSWWWQTVMLLRSPEADSILAESAITSLKH